MLIVGKNIICNFITISQKTLYVYTHACTHTRGSWVYVYVRRLTEHTITCSLTGVALFIKIAGFHTGFFGGGGRSV